MAQHRRQQHGRQGGQGFTAASIHGDGGQGDEHGIQQGRAHRHLGGNAHSHQQGHHQYRPSRPGEGAEQGRGKAQGQQRQGLGEGVPPPPVLLGPELPDSDGQAGEEHYYIQDSLDGLRRQQAPQGRPQQTPRQAPGGEDQGGPEGQLPPAVVIPGTNRPGDGKAQEAQQQALRHGKAAGAGEEDGQQEARHAAPADEEPHGAAPQGRQDQLI